MTILLRKYLSSLQLVFVVKHNNVLSGYLESVSSITCIENKISLNQGPGGVTSVTHYITVYEQTQ